MRRCRVAKTSPGATQRITERVLWTLQIKPFSNEQKKRALIGFLGNRNSSTNQSRARVPSLCATERRSDAGRRDAVPNYGELIISSLGLLFLLLIVCLFDIFLFLLTNGFVSFWFAFDFDVHSIFDCFLYRVWLTNSNDERLWFLLLLLLLLLLWGMWRCITKGRSWAPPPSPHRQSTQPAVANWMTAPRPRSGQLFPFQVSSSGPLPAPTPHSKRGSTEGSTGEGGPWTTEAKTASEEPGGPWSTESRSVDPFHSRGVHRGVHRGGPWTTETKTALEEPGGPWSNESRSVDPFHRGVPRGGGRGPLRPKRLWWSKVADDLTSSVQWGVHRGGRWTTEVETASEEPSGVARPPKKVSSTRPTRGVGCCCYF